MGSFKAQRLLMLSAAAFERQRQTFSKQEILNKINEIKYLSKQKKVPRLTLRKKIVHLENQFKSLSELEKKIEQQKKHETIRITALKNQIKTLKKQLSATEHKHLHKKVEKLAHLLGDNLAHKETAKNVEYAHIMRSAPVQGNDEDKRAALKKKLERVRSLLEKLKEKNPGHAAILERKINYLAQQLGEEVNVEKAIKHNVLFNKPKVDIELEKELPLPPPPMMGKEIS